MPAGREAGWPCRLQAVIRRLAAHGQRDLSLALRRLARHRQRDARAPRTSMLERGARCRRARPRACGGRLNAWLISLRMRAVGPKRPRRTPTLVCHAWVIFEAAPAAMSDGHPLQTLFAWHSQAPNAFASAARPLLISHPAVRPGGLVGCKQ